MTLYEAMRQKRLAERRVRDRGLDVARQIREHPETRLLSRGDLLPAYEYVERAFPSTAPAVAATVVYKNENTAFCKRMGIPRGVGGMFLVDASSILVCHNPFPDDVVVLHEMLHFVSQMLGSRFTNTPMEEDFAYSKSVNYLVSIGWERERIRDKYMLPYYQGRELSLVGHKPSREESDKAIEMAKSRCDKIIDEELGASRVQEASPIRSRFELL